MDNEKIAGFMQLTLKAILRNSKDLIFIKDTDLKYMGASSAFARMAGFERSEELLGKSDYEIFDSELARKYTEDDRLVLKSGEPIVNIIEPIPDNFGKKSYSSTSKYVIRDAGGCIIGLYGIGRDVTAEVELEEERERRRQSRQMFSAIIEADITENRMLNVDGSIWVKELGLTKDSLFTETVKAVSERFIAKEYAADFLKYYDINKLKCDYENGIEEFSHISYQNVGNEYRWTEFSSRVYYSRISGTLRITTFLKDLDDEIKTKERLTYIAVTDSLTGLLNRKSTMERIEKCLSSGENNSKHVLLFIDLDSFKQINDSKGHPFGDEVLKSVAGKLKMIFRRDDIIGRIGGDEFMVLLKNISSREEAEERAKHIFCGNPFSYIWEGKEEYITCSIGASLYTSGKTFDKLYAEADEAMYRAKKEGKNRLVFY